MARHIITLNYLFMHDCYIETLMCRLGGPKDLGNPSHAYDD